MSQATFRSPSLGTSPDPPCNHITSVAFHRIWQMLQIVLFLEERASWMSHIAQHAADSPTPRPSLETVARGRGFLTH